MYKKDRDDRRPRRRQVARACDWCRVNRVKCDDQVPCENCKNRDGKCEGRKGATNPSLPQAMREVEKLRARVSDLQMQLDNRETTSANNRLASPEHLLNLGPLSQRQWEGAWMDYPQGIHGQLYGPLSSMYFVSRLNSFLGLSLEQHRSAQSLLPASASRVFASPGVSTTIDGDPIIPDFLSRDQEGYFLGLFWQTFQITIPILNEAEFKQYYESLWEVTAGKQARAPSPIVDIILALCLQYGMGFVPRISAQGFSKADIDINDSSIAGRNYYRRCQALLTLELERPTITTLQCHIYSALYLQNASFVNMAHATMAVAFRTACVFGLHQEPRESLPVAQRELHRRLWWAVFTMETKISMTLGRPWLSQILQTSCSLPEDEQIAGELSGSYFISPRSDITWLSYQIQCIKLILVTQRVSKLFNDKCTQLITLHRQDIYHNSQSLEKLAEFLSFHLKDVEIWRDGVAQGLQIERKYGERSFSPGRATIVIDHLVPPWLQLQRVLLELRYHDQIMSLCRPFLRFSTSPGMSTPLSEGHATSCLNHSLANTFVMHQFLNETNTLHGWHEAYKLQWNAALSIAGFCLGYPISASTPAARQGLNIAIVVLNILGDNYAVAASAAIVMKDLAVKIDILVNRFQPSSRPLQQNSAAPSNDISDSSEIQYEYAEGVFQGDYGDSRDQYSILGEAGLQFPLDSFVDAEMLISDGSSSLLWQDFINDD